MIFIPERARGEALETDQISSRLRHILEFKQVRLLGDLHGLSFSEIKAYRNCGSKSLDELRGLVYAIQHEQPSKGASLGLNSGLPQTPPPPLSAIPFDVPTEVRDLKIADLPISARLEHALGRKGVLRLGDLRGTTTAELKGAAGFGAKTLLELGRLIERAASGEFLLSADIAWNPADMARLLDALVVDLADKTGQILLLRLGDVGDEGLSLKEVGLTFDLTTERIRQIVKHGVARIRRGGGRRLEYYLAHVERVCGEKVCPLTPPLLQQWFENSSASPRFSATFYVNLLGELKPTIPTWPAAHKACWTRTVRGDEICSALDRVLRGRSEPMPLPRALARVRDAGNLGEVQPTEFLAALHSSRRLKVEFPRPDAPVVRPAEERPARRSVAEIARAVLEQSDTPLTLEEILARARLRVGPDDPRWTPASVAGRLVAAGGFCLFDRRLYGLPRHCPVTQEAWPKLQDDFRALLQREKRPISTVEVVGSRRFEWAGALNRYELACILQQDERLLYLGKFLFALTEWGIKKREHVSYLIAAVLEQAGRALTFTELLERLQQRRSVTRSGLSTALRNTGRILRIRNNGGARYSLKSWRK